MNKESWSPPLTNQKPAVSWDLYRQKLRGKGGFSKKGKKVKLCEIAGWIHLIVDT